MAGFSLNMGLQKKKKKKNTLLVWKVLKVLDQSEKSLLSVGNLA